MSRRSSHVFLTLRDLRIAKIDRKVMAKPCAEEFENYMMALSATREDFEVQDDLASALSDCMHGLDSLSKPVSLKYHLKKFLKHEK